MLEKCDGCRLPGEGCLCSLVGGLDEAGDDFMEGLRSSSHL